MSKICMERLVDLTRCNLPAMTQHAGRWMCFTCRERLERAPARKRKTADELEADRQKLLGGVWNRKP